MSRIFIILTSILVLVACRETSQKSEMVCGSCHLEEEMHRATMELNKLDSSLIEFYDQAESEASKVLEKADELITTIINEPDPNNVRYNKLGALYDLRAEMLYRCGQYEKSIAEIYKHHQSDFEIMGYNSLGSFECIYLACNYAKLKDFEKTKIFIDSAGKGLYISNFVMANYYEVVGQKEKAFELYSNIKNDKTIDHYEYYGQAITRIEELSKANPRLLDEIFYPTSRPDHEICKTDNVWGTKIIDLINDLPEVKSCSACNWVSIYKVPDDMNLGCYWMKAGHPIRPILPEIMTEFWEEAFRDKQEMWGFEPAKSAVLTSNLFVENNVHHVLIPGIGYGRNAQVFTDNGMQVTGIEISQTAIDLAKKHFGNDLTIYHGSVTEMPFDDKLYEGIFCYGLIYLLDKVEREKLIQDCFNQLTENGIMVFTSITKDSPTYGQGTLISTDRFEMFGGVKIFFYDKETIEGEFGGAGLFEVVEVTENYPFHLIICRKNSIATPAR